MQLDKRQEEIVNYPGSALVLAGPGSGKTRILTAKASKLLKEGQNILCLTFTTAAAAEMSSRVKNLPATTIHSYCYGVVGWDPILEYPGLLYHFLKEKEVTQFDTVLVDEVQDINSLELSVIKALVKPGGHLFAVGDPFQSIMGFQNAIGPGIVDLLEEYGCKKQEIWNNYRSSPEMVGKIEDIYLRNLVSTGVIRNGLSAILCRTHEAIGVLVAELKEAGISYRLVESKDTQEEGRGARLSGNLLSNLHISTVHSAKGREFEHVALFGWPSPASLEDEEEVRVFYVAASRASLSFLSRLSLKETRQWAENQAVTPEDISKSFTKE